MTKNELQEVYESRNWSQYAEDEITGILYNLDDKDGDTIVDGYIKSVIKFLNKEIAEQSKYPEYVIKLSKKAVEELESLLKV